MKRSENCLHSTKFSKKSYIPFFFNLFLTMPFIFMNKSILFFINVSGIFILLTFFFLDNNITRKILRQMVEKKKRIFSISDSKQLYYSFQKERLGTAWLTVIIFKINRFVKKKGEEKKCLLT